MMQIENLRTLRAWRLDSFPCLSETDRTSIATSGLMSAENRASVSFLKLSTKGLENIASPGIGDFKLRLGEHRLSCSRFQASSISPRVTTALQNDSTITEYEIELEDGGSLDLNTVLDLLSLSRSGSDELTASNCSSILAAAKSLGNCDYAKLSEKSATTLSN
jgi:hypothetical protein